MSATSTGPLWQHIPPGTRVRAKRGRKFGTVVRVLESRPSDGVTTSVSVRWDSRKHPEHWATDCLAPLPDDPPEVFTSAHWEPKGQYWALSIACPHCGKVHHHGGGSGTKPDLGHRVSHCITDTPNRGYVLVAEPTGPGVDELQVGQRVTIQLIGTLGEICRGDITAIEPSAILLAGIETWSLGEHRRHHDDELVIFRSLIGSVTIEREARAFAS